MEDNAVNLQVLGCGDAFSSGGNFNTCFYLNSLGFQVLLDCGVTSLLAIKKHKLSTLEIDMIAISHFHGDHFGGLPFFLLDASTLGRTKPLTIISPPGCKEKLEQAVNLLYPGSSVLDKFPIEFISYQAHTPVKSGPVTVEAFPVVHTEKTLPHGLRVTINNKTVGFSGDTSWTDELFGIAHDADLFICECNFYDMDLKGHLNYQTILSYRDRLKCKRILLTHMGDQMLQKTGEIEMDYAWDGRKITI